VALCGKNRYGLKRKFFTDEKCMADSEAHLMRAILLTLTTQQSRGKSQLDNARTSCGGRAALENNRDSSVAAEAKGEQNETALPTLGGARTLHE
jgi:hypothetical protein